MSFNFSILDLLPSVCLCVTYIGFLWHVRGPSLVESCFSGAKKPSTELGDGPLSHRATVNNLLLLCEMTGRCLQENYSAK